MLTALGSTENVAIDWPPIAEQTTTLPSHLSLQSWQQE